MTTHHLAVFGNPVAHSRSPDIHAMFAEQAGLDLVYERVLVPEGRFAEVADKFLASGEGFNVTLPCKSDAWRYVDVASETADNAQAVNTVSRDPAGLIRGDNTDGPGLVRDLQNNLDWSLAGKNVLILGAGGAVSGVLTSLVETSPARIDIFNRTRERADELAARYTGDLVTSVAREDLLAGYDLIINGTSTGLTGGRFDLPDTIVTSVTRCYDMVYSQGNEATGFNSWCQQRQAGATADGLGMLVEQAARSFEIWFDQAVATQPVIDTLRQQMTSEGPQQ